MAVIDMGPCPFPEDYLEGVGALVTGGGSGLGQGIAIGLASCGAHVVVSGRRADALKGTVEAIRERGGRADGVVCDVRDPESVASAVAEADERTGALGVLVNNAGATFTVASEDLTPNGFRAVVETDAFGTFYTCQEFGKRVKARGDSGAILNITSTSPMTGNPGRLHGGVGKAGVESITKTLAVEWGRYGIRVNSLAPGYTPTAGVNKATFVREGAAAQETARLASGVPLGRVGTVGDIAWPAVFLMTPAASFINGASLVVDGGKWLSSGRGIAGVEGTAAPS